MNSFATVIVDVDSTLSGIEGIDWLAARRGPELARRIASLTAEAMTGERKLSEVFADRLAMVRPSRQELSQLAEAYWKNTAPGAVACLAKLQLQGIRIDVVSSGYSDAVVPFGRRLGVAGPNVHSVGLSFDAAGEYAAYDATSPLVSDRGKRLLVEGLKLPGPVLAVGDGITDAEIRPAANAFAAYTGFVRREQVVRIADFVLASFVDLERVALGGADIP